MAVQAQLEWLFIMEACLSTQNSIDVIRKFGDLIQYCCRCLYIYLVIWPIDSQKVLISKEKYKLWNHSFVRLRTNLIHCSMSHFERRIKCQGHYWWLLNYAILSLVPRAVVKRFAPESPFRGTGTSVAQIVGVKIESCPSLVFCLMGDRWSVFPTQEAACEFVLNYHVMGRWLEQLSFLSVNNNFYPTGSIGMSARSLYQTINRDATARSSSLQTDIWLIHLCFVDLIVLLRDQMSRLGVYVSINVLQFWMACWLLLPDHFVISYLFSFVYLP